ncbi:hypothetical protein HAR72_003174 [Salmonella enterica]|nr:hypothetical protein [Salmonella enterica subsp. enterica serovar Typhimurium]
MILKSDVEADAKEILDSLRKDYEIPSSGKVIYPVIKIMTVVYIMHFLAYLINDVVYQELGRNIFGEFTCFLISCAVLTIMALMMTYGSLSIVMCIPKKQRDESLLLEIIKKRLRAYFLAVVIINTLTAIVMINVGPGFIVCYGFSWFASFLIGGIVFSMSMSRYMTPAVVAALDKIREVISTEKDHNERTV